MIKGPFMRLPSPHQWTDEFRCNPAAKWHFLQTARGSGFGFGESVYRNNGWAVARGVVGPLSLIMLDLVFLW